MLFDFDLADGCMEVLLSFERPVASHRFERVVLRARHFVYPEKDRGRALEAPVRVVIPAESQREQSPEFSSDCVGREHSIDEHLTTLVVRRFERAVLRAEHFVCPGQDRSRAVKVPVLVVLPPEAQQEQVFGYSPDCVGRQHCIDGHLTILVVRGFEFAPLRAEHSACPEEDRSCAVEISLDVVLPLEVQHQKISELSPDAVGRIPDNRSSLRRSLTILTIFPNHQHPDTVGMNLSHQSVYRSGGSVHRLAFKACRYTRDRSALLPRHATHRSQPVRKNAESKNHTQTFHKLLDR